MQRVEQMHQTHAQAVKRQLEEVTAALGKAHQQIASLQEKYCEDTAQLAEKLQLEHQAKIKLAQYLRSEKEDHQQTQTRLETTLAQLQEELTSRLQIAEQDLSLSKQLFTDKAQAFEALTALHEKSQTDLAQQVEYTSQLKGQIQHTQSELAQVRSQNNWLAEERLKQTREYEDAVSQWREELCQCQTEKAQTENARRRLEQQYAALQEEVQHLAQAKEKATLEVEWLQTVLKQKEDQPPREFQESPPKEFQEKPQETEYLQKVQGLEQQIADLQALQLDQTRQVQHFYEKWLSFCPAAAIYTPATLPEHVSAIVESGKQALSDLQSDSHVARITHQLEKATQQVAGLQQINQNLQEQKEILKKQLSLPPRTPWKESLLTVGETLQLGELANVSPRTIAQRVIEKVKKKGKTRTLKQKLAKSKQKCADLRAALANYKESTASQEAQLQHLQQRVSDLEVTITSAELRLLSS